MDAPEWSAHAVRFARRPCLSTSRTTITESLTWTSFVRGGPPFRTNDVSDTKILDCPCCGGEAFHTWKTDDEPHYLVQHFVLCKDCGLKIGGYGGKESTIAKWNRRHAPEASNAAKRVTEPQVRAEFIAAGAWQDPYTAEWEMGDDELQTAVRAIIAKAKDQS